QQLPGREPGSERVRSCGAPSGVAVADGVPDYLDWLDADPDGLFFETFETGVFVGWCRVVDMPGL
ncbi:MAG TPA: hypothetical protein VLA66_09635, partial [Thermoanaerobaculia bacterium]|nr:hypothetical protein [Thermoanaerobaculia bacterium]